MTRIYLAGGKGDWRNHFQLRVTGSKDGSRHSSRKVDLVDPWCCSRQGAIAEFTLDDLASIATSDLVFGYCNFERYSGMALEFGYAYAKGIPIIYVAGQPRIDSMMVGVAKAAFTDLDAAIDFVIERYLGE